MLKNIISKFEKLNKDYPCALILTGLFVSIIPLICYENNQYYAFALILIISALSLIIFDKKISLKLFLWIIIGIFIYLFNSDLFFYHSAFSQPDEKILQGQREIFASVTDFKTVGKNFNWLSNPKSFEIKIKKYRIDKNDKWINCNIKAMATIQDSESLVYGDKILLIGYVFEPPDTSMQGTFNYKKYLKTLNIKYQFYGRITKIEGKEKNITADFFYNLRNKMLKNLCLSINNNQIKNFLAGIAFGCRQNISPEIKENFIKNGIIHILAISGLHVGILALILFIVFRFISVQIRFLFIPALLLLYVMMIGFQPSAVRAFIMISVFCLFRVFFLSDKPLNNILFAAVILILANPYIIDSAGFQFSFLLTGVLVFSWRKCTEWEKYLFEKYNWLPQKKIKTTQKINLKIKTWICSSVFSCLIAALASSGLTLYYQKLIIPLMPLLNLIIIPLLFPLIFLICFKILIVCLFGNLFNSLLNFGICIIVKLIFGIASLGSSTGMILSVNYIPSFFIFAFYLLIILFILTNKKTIKITSLIICLIFFIYTSYGNCFLQRKEEYIFKPAGNTGYSIIKIDNLKLTADIINLPGYYSANNILNFLKNHNINKINNLYISASTKVTCNNVNILIKQIQAGTIIINKNIRKSLFLEKMIKNCNERKIRTVFRDFCFNKEIKLLNSNKLYIKKISPKS